MKTKPCPIASIAILLAALTLIAACTPPAQPTRVEPAATATGTTVPTATPIPSATAAPTEPPPTAAATETPETADATPTPAPTATATLTSAPTATPMPTPTETGPDPADGQALWPQKPCANCHGDSAQGDFGPRLMGTELSYEEVLQIVRAGRGSMPAFAQDQITDQELRHVYAWLTE